MQADDKAAKHPRLHNFAMTSSNSSGSAVTQGGVADTRLRHSPPLEPLLCGIPLALSAQSPGTFPNRFASKAIVAILDTNNKNNNNKNKSETSNFSQHSKRGHDRRSDSNPN